MTSPQPRSQDAPLRIVVDACLIPGIAGGIEQATSSLVAALGRLGDDDEQYIVLTDPEAPDWLDPWIGPNTRVIPRPRPGLLKQGVKRACDWVPRLESPLRRARRWLRSTGSVAPLDPFVEGLHPDIVHFPYQRFHSTSAPSIFNPWDLLHIHHPEFFTARELHTRADLYPAWSRAATVLEVASQHTAKDLIECLHLPPDKIYVVPRAAPTALRPRLEPGLVDQVASLYGLPRTFMYYPAQSWPHKNHVRLLRALKLVRDTRGLDLSLVCTGRANEFWPVIDAEIHSLELEGCVRWLDYVPDEHVRALYRLANFTVFPSLFEGSGLPVLEALAEGGALSCSAIPVLEEQVGAEADLFDPTSVDSIAASLVRVVATGGRRSNSERDLRRRMSLSAWGRAVGTYRALYRYLAGVPLTPPEREALSAARSSAEPPTEA